MIRVVAFALCVLATSVRAQPSDDSEQRADHAFHDALTRAAAGDATALDALEAVGTARPATRWTDDAWSEAARIAEQRGDFARALRDLDQAIATATDEALLRRAKAARTRISGFAGEGGEWTAVAATHERLVAQVEAGGDPKPALRELAALVEANPRYPRATLAMLVLARGWERDGDVAEARRWLAAAERVAAPADRERVRAEAAKLAARTGDLDGARAAIAGISDRAIVRELERTVDRAQLLRTLRWIAWAVLALVVAFAVVALRRGAGSWRAVGRRLARPPIEVWFFVPIAAVFVLVAQTGNPLVAAAVRAIAIAGAVCAWVSGALLDGAGPLRVRRVIVHVVLAGIAVLAAAYLAVDRGQMIDLVIETWRSGPAGR